MRHEGIIGRKIAGRITVKRLLGEGGMAAVYVGERDIEPRQVAVKIMNADLCADRAFVRRFQREAKAASVVKHPSSVTIYEYGTEGNLSYIVMELLDGHDLYQLLELYGVLPQARAARILAAVCDVLQVAHEMGIIHRDLKPENIMVIPDVRVPQGERVKVLDFGIAKLLEVEEIEESGPIDSADGPPSAITRVGQIVGTPAYMSPEQCGLLPVDTRSDIYTCGVLLFQLVTGRLPFEGDTPFHTASLHIHAPIPSAAAFAPGLDPRLDALIQKALAKRPAERHQTARHLGASLRKLLPMLSDASLVTGPISRRQISSRWPREEARVIGAALEDTPPATPIAGLAATPRVQIQPALMPQAPTPARPPGPLAALVASSNEPYSDEESLESAKTLVSTAAEIGTLPQVLLNDPLQVRQSYPSSDDIQTLEHDRSAAPPAAPRTEDAIATRPRPMAEQAPSAGWPTASVLPGVPRAGARLPGDLRDDDPDEDRAVTLIRTASDSSPDLDFAAGAQRPGVREVKSTLRSAEEFGIKPPVPEKRPEVQVQIPAAGARHGHAGPSSDPTDMLARSGRGVPAAAVSPQVLKTVRINQPAGTGPNPAPPRDNYGSGGTFGTPVPRPTGTLPIPPQAPVLPPTVNDMAQFSGPQPSTGGGLLSGRVGLLIGFMAGMVITAILVIVYLFVLR